MPPKRVPTWRPNLTDAARPYPSGAPSKPVGTEARGSDAPHSRTHLTNQRRHLALSAVSLVPQQTSRRLAGAHDDVVAN